MMFHKDLTPQRWFQFSVAKQLANVGSDIERTIQWKNDGEIKYSELAFYRALELLSLTIIDPKNRGPRRRELCRVRETLIDHFLFNNTYNTTDDDWQRYFYDFTYASALERERKRAHDKKE